MAQDPFAQFAVAEDPFAAFVAKPEDAHASLVKANATPLREPTTFAGGFLRSLGHTAAEAGKGVLEGPWKALQAGMQGKADTEAKWVRQGQGESQETPPIGQQLSDAASGIKDSAAALTDPRTGGNAIGALAFPMVAEAVGPAAMRTVAQAAPMAGRIAKTAAGMTVGAVADTPIIGGALKGGAAMWRGTAPAMEPAAVAEVPTGRFGFEIPSEPALKPREVTLARKAGITPEEIHSLTRSQILAKMGTADPVAAAPAIEAPPTASAPGKPKLTAPEVAQYLRNEYGSDRAGRMLYGTKGADRPNVLSPAERQANVKRLAPQGQSSLPESTMREVRDKVRLMTPEQAKAYAETAPNKLMRQYLLDLMRSGG